MTEKRALILSGGGARAAYQVGVLQALAEILPESDKHPFPIICGTSAGAINAVALAAHPGTFKESVTGLAKMWSELTIDQVYLHGLILSRQWPVWDFLYLTRGQERENLCRFWIILLYGSY